MCRCPEGMTGNAFVLCSPVPRKLLSYECQKTVVLYSKIKFQLLLFKTLAIHLHADPTVNVAK